MDTRLRSGCRSTSSRAAAFLSSPSTTSPRYGDRFRWKSGTKPCLYGLHRLHEAHKARHVVLVEGESDCHTLWFHEIPALGIPGATNWREERDARYLDGIETIYVVVEPDRGGDAVRKWLSRSPIRPRAKLVSLPVKDPSALHLEDPDQFTKRWQIACLGAMPWTAIEASPLHPVCWT